MTRASLTLAVRIRSEEYMAALYILSYDEEIFKVSRNHVTEVGIDFDAIKRKMDDHCMAASQYILVLVAQSLFNDYSAELLPLYALTELDYDVLDIVVDALYIRKGRGRIPTHDEHGNMMLNDEKEQMIRTFISSDF